VNDARFRTAGCASWTIAVKNPCAAKTYTGRVRVALCSDEPYPVHNTVRVWLEESGHEVVPFGSVETGAETAWALAAEAAAEAVARGDCEQGVFF
jgi:hypothetical protein